MGANTCSGALFCPWTRRAGRLHAYEHSWRARSILPSPEMAPQGRGAMPSCSQRSASSRSCSALPLKQKRVRETNARTARKVSRKSVLLPVKGSLHLLHLLHVSTVKPLASGSGGARKEGDESARRRHASTTDGSCSFSNSRLQPRRAAPGPAPRAAEAHPEARLVAAAWLALPGKAGQGAGQQLGL